VIVEALLLWPALWLDARGASGPSRDALAARLGLFSGPWRVLVTTSGPHSFTVEIVQAHGHAFGNLDIEERTVEVEHRHFDDRCLRLFRQMKAYCARNPHAPVAPTPWCVNSSYMDTRMRSLGLGTVLYREAVRAAARRGGFLFPDACFTMGTTSTAARQVWRRLTEDESLLAVEDPSGWPIVLASPQDFPWVPTHTAPSETTK
jgi:GNAT superfamily N-acetyltransferase